MQRRVTALTCLLVTTLPIGLVESITTQTDYVVTGWFACLTCLTLALWNDPANFAGAAGAGPGDHLRRSQCASPVAKLRSVWIAAGLPVHSVH